MPEPIRVYRAPSEKDRQTLVADLSNAYRLASAAQQHDDQGTPDQAESEDLDLAPVSIPEFSSDLIGIDPSVYRQINAALKSGKRHLLLYGPPGTGKTTIAQMVAATLHDRYTMITGSADWTSQDIIGGYHPTSEGTVQFYPGILLRSFDSPLILDELNRCDIDKVIGPLFTVLSGQKTTLPYRSDFSREDSPSYVILPQPKSSKEPHEFAPTAAWRIIATINTVDKASLYQMSYALARRFAWIYVDIPSDLDRFITDFLQKRNWIDLPETTSEPIVLGSLWERVNYCRRIGPAPVIDMIAAMREMEPDFDYLGGLQNGQAGIYIEAFSMYLLPMLEGILRSQAEELARSLCELFAIDGDDPDGRILTQRLLEVSV